eukprot:2131296-Prymnesium_polylepis.2
MGGAPLGRCSSSICLWTSAIIAFDSASARLKSYLFFRSAPMSSFPVWLSSSDEPGSGAPSASATLYTSDVRLVPSGARWAVPKRHVTPKRHCPLSV